MTVQIPLYSKNFGRLSGERAWRQNLDLAALSAAKVASCLGPTGSYKMVTYNRGPERVVKVTKDPVEVLSELEVQYPAVKTIAEAARIHREQAGDGVSTFIVVLAGLLEEARRLSDRGVHPTVILRGYHEATKRALAVIDEAAYVVDGDATTLLLGVVDCGRGLLSGALLHAVSEAAARAQAQGGIDRTRIRMVRQSGASVAESELIKGIVIKKSKAHPSMPGRVENAKVALVSKKLDVRPVESLMNGKGPFNMKLLVEGGDLGRFKRAETSLRKGIAEKVAASGASVVICRSKIAPEVADELSQRGVLAFELVDQQDVEAVAEATGGLVVGDVSDIRQEDLGFATKVEERKLDAVDHVSLEAEKGSTLLLRGSSLQETEETERLVRSAIIVLKRAQKDPRVVPGGGAVYMQIAMRSRDLALEYTTREQVAIQAFAAAMERVPECLARNYGLTRASVLTELRSLHAKGHLSTGITRSGCDAMDKDVVELASIAKLVVQRACEVATLLLRVDDYFYVKALPLVHKK